jgi:hypothetical protein
MRLGRDSRLRPLLAMSLVAVAAKSSVAGDREDGGKVFNRIAAFPVFLNLPADVDVVAHPMGEARLEPLPVRR